MKYFNFNTSLRFLVSRKKQSGSLVEHPDIVWNGSVIFLLILLAGVLAFDGYVFFVRVGELENQNIDVGQEGVIADIKKNLVGSARGIIEERAKTYTSAGENLPARNPFLQ